MTSDSQYAAYFFTKSKVEALVNIADMDIVNESDKRTACTIHIHRDVDLALVVCLTPSISSSKSVESEVDVDERLGNGSEYFSSSPTGSYFEVMMYKNRNNYSDASRCEKNEWKC